MSVEDRKIIIREPIKKFVEVGMPANWSSVSDADGENFDKICREILSLEPLSDEESLLIGENLTSDDDLDGIGQSLGGAIASAPSWKTGAIFYTNTGGLPALDIKGETFFAGAPFEFSSLQNEKLILNIKNYQKELGELKPEINLIEFHFIMSLFLILSSNDFDKFVFSNTKNVIKKFVDLNAFDGISQTEKDILKDKFDI